MNKLEVLINVEDAGANHKKLLLKNYYSKITLETEDKKKLMPIWTSLLTKVSALSNIFKEKYDDFQNKILNKKKILKKEIKL